MWRTLLLLALALPVALLGVAALALAKLRMSPTELAALMSERSPSSAVRYLGYRLDGHPRLEAVAAPLLDAARRRYEREPPAKWATFGKGSQDAGLVPLRFDGEGRPQPTWPWQTATRTSVPTRAIAAVEELQPALAGARAGDVLELAPGDYDIRRSLETRTAGTPESPIVLRAAKAGTVRLHVHVQHGLRLSQPYWVIENLDWRGACKDVSDCEHALHIVGLARGVAVLNNAFSNFNAHIKVNGERGKWPDDGLLQFNTLSNDGPRSAARPITPVDIVGASGWRVLDNRIVNFPRPDVHNASYGVFMKGGGKQGRIERNLIICSTRGLSAIGERVGISIGGGGTGVAYCRSPGCETEHEDAVVANNVVAHCNDTGIDVARARNVQVLHNTLINAQGVVLRSPPSTARVQGNVIEGRIYSRAGTQVEEGENMIVSDARSWFVDADGLDLRWQREPPLMAATQEAKDDMCMIRRPPLGHPGALANGYCRERAQR